LKGNKLVVYWGDHSYKLKVNPGILYDGTLKGIIDRQEEVMNQHEFSDKVINVNEYMKVLSNYLIDEKGEYDGFLSNKKLANYMRSFTFSGLLCHRFGPQMVRKPGKQGYNKRMKGVVTKPKKNTKAKRKS
jgi:hypothetical protein